MIGIAITVFSLMGSIGLILGFTPQVIKTWKSKNTLHLSLLMWILIVVATIFFVIYGISFIGKYASESDKNVTDLISGLSLIISNIVVFAEAALVVYLKLKHKKLAKESNISEEEVIKMELEKTFKEKVKK